MAGKNKGKKYVKLKGGEVATPENEARARRFLTWYATHGQTVTRDLIYKHLFDDQVATDTMLSIYDGIALKGLEIRDYKFYFLRAYHTNYLAHRKRVSEAAGRTVALDAPVWDDGQGDYLRIADTLVAPTFDYEHYEAQVEQIKTEITEYVRAHYDAAACSLFEMYIALQPDMSYKRLAKMLGFPVQWVWPVIGAIKKDLKAAFMARKDYILFL